MESIIRSARVIDIILDNTHIDFQSTEDIGTIFYKPIESYGHNHYEFDTKRSSPAKPLFSFIKNYPLRHEIVLIITSQANDHKLQTTDYYFPTLNIWNDPHHNAYPFGPLAERPTYQNTENGLSEQEDTEEHSLILGNYFKEIEGLKPLLPYEGDVILEGRFGNSIRFGSTVNNTEISRTNKWSKGGEIGDPITIIRNGQSTNFNKSAYIVEEINEDNSSIYLTSNQQLSDFEPVALNFKSWGANLIGKKKQFVPTFDKQVEPEIVEQELPEEEEPVIVEPVIEEEVLLYKTFEDDSTITEDNTDTNKITPDSSIILNVGTLRYKWVSEENNPQPEQFQEVTNGLDQMIGANFTLKHLISSETAKTPEFGIHEDAELERVGIYFHSTGVSETGVVQGHYVKDILGFYHIEGGFKEFVSVKDSDMNELHKTTGLLSGNLHILLSMAEQEMFSAGSPYHEYNMPNPGINNYPGIDSDQISGDEIVNNLKKVIENCIDKIIEHYEDIELISAYRSIEVNNSVDGSINDDHTKGYAIDFRIIGIKTSEVFNWCVDNLEEWKDLMWAYPERGENSWIHISYVEGENELHTTLASEMDSIHEWYESDRRGSSEQYQDGILEANQELI